MIRSILGRRNEIGKNCQFLLLLAGGILYPCVVYSTRQMKPVSCRSDNYPSKYKHCNASALQGGVDCFVKPHQEGLLTCQWRHEAAKEKQANFTLVVRQKEDKFCQVYKPMSNTLTGIPVFEDNLTVEVLLQNGSNCSKTNVTTHHDNLLRCGPPHHVTFRRYSDSRVNVSARWSSDDTKVIAAVCVRYKEVTDHHRHDDGRWRQVCCQGAPCHLAGLKGSPVLEVQVACNISDKCAQCPWGHVCTLPPELTQPPLSLHVVENKMADKGGQRIISLTWTFSEAHDGFNVSVAKASGEPSQQVFTVARPAITLLLSTSVFRVHVYAFNNVSLSPAAGITLTPPHEDDDGGRLSVRVHNQTSFSVLWKDDLVRKYNCFCLEWSATCGPRPPNLSYEAFYEDVNNNWTLVDIPERLRAFVSYDVWLHVRDERETCDLKQVNNSEATYATARFYFLEGTPDSAPPNFSVVSATSSSLELRWSAILPENRRGFLLGYLIYYADNRQPERNIRVEPWRHNYTLEGLRSGTAYRIQVSGFTRVGPGNRSVAMVVETRIGGSLNRTALLTISILVLLTAMLATPFLRRAKVVFWPNIPNPDKSKSMQSLNAHTHLLLQPVDSLKPEECDVASLLVVELRAPPSKRQQSARGRSAAAEEQSAANSHDPLLAAPFSGYTSMDVIQQLMMMGEEGRSRGRLRDAV
ncbi:interleukin-31 receptor subunit alpha isoform X2 [Vanacampus margaritifer]